ncbi:hypothetical protein LXL04_037394 [Taraxacum kok-saghyz]
MHKKNVCTYAKFLEKKKSFFRKFFFATGLIFERFLAPRSRFFEKVNDTRISDSSAYPTFSVKYFPKIISSLKYTVLRFHFNTELAGSFRVEKCEEIVDHQAVKYDGGAVRRSKLFPFTLFFFNLLFIMLNENEFESVKGSGGCVDAVSAAIETLEHHCRNCGDIFCDKCTQGRIALTAEENAQQVRVCDQCMAEVTQRLSHVNEVAANKASGFNRHEDLAKKLQEEMEKKRRATESKSNVANLQMKDVECPTCTVHLQVTGSKTIECSVCQHPFLVSGS